MIKIDFERLHETGVFRDSLALPDDHTYTEQQILELQNQRFAEWLAAIAQAEG